MHIPSALILGPSFTTATVAELSGTVQFEAGAQTLALPVRYGAWNGLTGASADVEQTADVATIGNYVVDRLEAEYGAGVVSVANCIIGDVGSYYNFVPAVMGNTHAHNFPLMYEDTGVSSWEPVGFIIQCTQAMTMDWVGWQTSA